jgi:hypothetical protein
MSKFALEKYRLFPYVAWGTVIGFSLFVFQLTQNLIQATSDLRNARNDLEALVHTPTESIDFNRRATTPIRTGQ